MRIRLSLLRGMMAAAMTPAFLIGAFELAVVKRSAPATALATLVAFAQMLVPATLLGLAASRVAARWPAYSQPSTLALGAGIGALTALALQLLQGQVPLIGIAIGAALGAVAGLAFHFEYSAHAPRPAPVPKVGVARALLAIAVGIAVGVYIPMLSLDAWQAALDHAPTTHDRESIGWMLGLSSVVWFPLVCLVGALLGLCLIALLWPWRSLRGSRTEDRHYHGG